MAYTVVLDPDSSYLVPSDKGVAFDKGVDMIIEYIKDNKEHDKDRASFYETQQIIWEMMKEEGESSLETFPLKMKEH